MSPKSSIPSWQRATSLPGAEEQKPETSTPPAEASSDAEVSNNGPEELEELEEQALKFLEDPSIKGASLERKIAFLESKGLKREDVESLVGKHEVKENAPAQASPSQTVPTQSTSPVRDVPPVIAYPEFLVHANKPAPLVTTNLLMNTAYVTAGLYATVYGLSKYIIAPMEAALTQSRHELLNHTFEQLENFNTRMTTMVSTVPQANSPVLKSDNEHGHADNDSDTTSDSDPTELFHRDFGTQTSPALSRRASSSEDSSPYTPPDVTTGHESRLKIMASHLKELETSGQSYLQKEDDIAKQLSALTSYLNEMSFSSPYYRYGSNYSWSTPAAGATGSAKDDEIEKLKTEIRSVKGVLLSTRNFPRGQKS